MLYKNVSDSSIGGVIKDVDVKTGTVTGYFAVFGNIDSDGDMIMPGAFKRTLTNNIKRIKHLAYHDPWQPLSKPAVLKEDTKGLYFESTIVPTSYGKDIIQLYQSGVLDEHSIGYEVVRDNKLDKYKELIELKLWEGSTVTWGANEQAGTNSVKSMTKEQCLIKLDYVLKAIKNGKFEGEDLHDSLELYFKQLEQHIIDLSASSTQPAPVAPDPQKGVKSDDLPADEILSLLHLNHSLLKKQVQNETQLYRMAVS